MRNCSTPLAVNEIHEYRKYWGGTHSNEGLQFLSLPPQPEVTNLCKCIKHSSEQAMRVEWELAKADMC